MSLPSNQILDDFLTNQRQEVKAALMILALELERARTKHPLWPEDIIHRAAIVCEEAGELQRAALHVTYEHGPLDQALVEAAHTGATCLRFLIHKDSTRANNSLISLGTFECSSINAYSSLLHRLENE